MISPILIFNFDSSIGMQPWSIINLIKENIKFKDEKIKQLSKQYYIGQKAKTKCYYGLVI